MKSEIWDSLEAIGRAQDVPSLREAFVEAVRGCGFNAAYFLAPVVADPRVGRALTNIGFPDEWEAQYRSEWYLIDPLPSLAMSRISTFVWPDDVQLSHLTNDQRDYLTTIKKFGMGQGLAVPCFGPFARVGFVGLDMANNDTAFDSSNIVKAEIAARFSFTRYALLEKPFGSPLPSLSDREAEVLRWIAAGKSNAVIGDILGIQPSSINEYVKRLFAKLGVTDRTSASVQALAQGLIVTGSYPYETRDS